MSKKKPRLLFFVTEDWYFLSHRLPLARGAIKAGFEVYLVTRVGEYSQKILSEGIRLIPIDIRRFGTNPFIDLCTITKLLRIIAQVSPRIVHNVAMKPSLYGSLVANLLGIPRVINAFAGMGYLFVSDQLMAKMLRPLVILAFRLIIDRPHTKVIFQNIDDRDMFIKYGIIKPERCVIIRGSGVDIHRFVPTPEPQGVPVVILAARLLWDKGVREFAAAAQSLKDEGVKARFALVGNTEPGNPASVPESFITTRREQGVIECWGRYDHGDMASVFQKSHVVCLPSYREGLPKVLLEAAACARPIVTTDTPGCREIVRHNQNGFLAPVKDSVELSNYLKILIESPSLRQQMGARGREMVVSQFSDDKVVADTLHLYHQCL